MPVQRTPPQIFRAQMAEVVQELLEQADCFRTCLSCIHFKEADELCVVSNPPARPPARIIAFGCPAYQDTETPLSKIPTPTIPKKVVSFDDMDDDIPF